MVPGLLSLPSDSHCLIIRFGFIQKINDKVSIWDIILQGCRVRKFCKGRWIYGVHIMDLFRLVSMGFEIRNFIEFDRMANYLESSIYQVQHSGAKWIYRLKTFSHNSHQDEKPFKFSKFNLGTTKIYIIYRLYCINVWLDNFSGHPRFRHHWTKTFINHRVILRLMIDIECQITTCSDIN